MEKRAIYAILLTFIVIVAWSLIQSKFFPQPTKTQPHEVRKELGPPQEKVPEKKAEIRESKVLKGEKPGARLKIVPQRDISVETQNYWAVFTSGDARLKHFRLKKYEDRVNQAAVTTKLTQFVAEILGKKPERPKKPEPLDLVNTRENENLPLGLTLNGAILPVEENWEVDKDQLRLLQDNEKGEIIFSKNLKNGLKILKRLKFMSDQYTIHLEVEVQNSSSKEITTQLGLEWIGEIELVKLAKEDNKDFGLKYAFLRNQKVEKKAFGGTSTSGCVPGCGTQKKTSIEPFEITDKGEIKWFSFEGEYFAALIIPPESKDITLSVKGSEKDLLRAEIIPPGVSISPREKVNVAYRVYLGPKDEDRLKALGVGAEKLVDFGYFTIVAKPLLWFIRLTHKVTGNYGIDIIIISILIKIIFLPLTQISFKSMKEMQRVQPEMNRLKEQYKNDKARQQQEIMLLYKRRKINPMSGCLPMLIQIPVFIALYNALQNGIEMRHAPFFLWIMDLSAKDPIYITPIIMGATMFLQQKMTPTAGDPAQAKMFLLMPVMFTFLFLSFPSGLVLYWLINNVLSIAHQYYLNKKI
jgi:YidC/Oxa1 family membrane protein insertase